jgi:ribosome-associated translation inhibitor RaiA
LLVQVSTDSQIEGNAELEAATTDRVTRGLDRFGDQITRIEVHLTDENSGAKGGALDIRCTLEARVSGRQPVVVRHDAANVDQATDGAVRKMRTLLDRELGKLGRH